MTRRDSPGSCGWRETFGASWLTLYFGYAGGIMATTKDIREAVRAELDLMDAGWMGTGVSAVRDDLFATG